MKKAFFGFFVFSCIGISACVTAHDALEGINTNQSSFERNQNRSAKYYQQKYIKCLVTSAGVDIYNSGLRYNKSKSIKYCARIGQLLYESAFNEAFLTRPEVLKRSDVDKYKHNTAKSIVSNAQTETFSRLESLWVKAKN